MTNKSKDLLGALIKQIEEPSAPLDTWAPQHCGAIDIRITSDGVWHHAGSPIKRDKLVKLFAKVLCQEDGQYYLKTPVEKMAIEVEDAPLLIVDWRLQSESHHAAHDVLVCKDNVGREFIVGEAHPLIVREDVNAQQLPYLLLPHGVEAKIARAVFYAWAQELIETTHEGFVIYSGATSFSLGSGA
ncbi:DUF1285 domain-containing protein [Pseudoalteromonas sp. YIC-656]|uniref:DUF1285 domain-containing protein n=1 Tax=Pseudoalteromonas pernae TaxID=3118054 RepID=UPI003242A388